MTLEIPGVTAAAPMARLRAHDPFLHQVLAREDAVRKPWVQPVEFTHLWYADVERVPAGAHRVTVRARGEYGREHVAHTVLDVGA